ncbi:membrane protein containing DUF6, transmembrane [mine drainage metagenome]|uniref:Membrane protein containing DUF6, transmembrane n=1 Tax=mine drainage metagenome TaxID=410659 RepID=T0ZFS9_9ZZZZ
MAVSPTPAAGPRDASTPSRSGLDGGTAGLLVALAVFWGLAYLFIRAGIQGGASPLLFAAVRYLLSAAAFGALALARREPTRDRRSWAISALVGGVLIIGLYGGFLYTGEQYTTGGYAAVLSSTAPLLTALAALVLLPNERPSRLATLGLGLGFAGAIVLVLPSLSSGGVGTWPGPELLLAAFASTAIGTVLLRRLRTPAQSLGQIGVQFAVAGALLAAGALAIGGSPSLPATPDVLGSLGALVAVSSVLGYFTYFRLHHRVGPVRANTVAYLIPLVGAGIGSGLLGEPFSVWEGLGFVLVAAGVALVARGGRPSSRPTGTGALPDPSAERGE